MPLKRLGTALVAAALAIVATGASAQTTRVRFSLDWLFQGPSAFFLTTAAKGYFKEEGLEVVIDAGNGSAGVLNRVAAGTHDMALADVGAMIEFLGNNEQNPQARLQGVLVFYDASPAAVVTLKRTGIKTPKDLEGRNLGAPIFDAGRKNFPMFAQAVGIDTAKIKWTTMDPPLRETMLWRGEVDAITGFIFSNWFSLLQRGAKDEDIVAWKFADYGTSVYGSFIIASPRFVAEQPEAIRKFNRALVKGVRDVLKDPDAAIQFVRARDPLIDVPLETRRLKMAIDVTMNTANFKSGGMGGVNKVRLEESTAAVVRAYNMKSSPNVDNMFNSSFLPGRGERQIW
jgi:NitT/TauT family transport system substrate-binding protein